MALEWKKMTVQQLKGELKRLGLEDTGRKTDLIERLTKHANKDTKGPHKPTVVPKSIFDEPSDSESEPEEEHIPVSADKKSVLVNEKDKPKLAAVKGKSETAIEKGKAETAAEKEKSLRLVAEQSKLNIERGNSLPVIKIQKCDSAIGKEKTKLLTEKAKPVTEKEKPKLAAEKEKPKLITEKKKPELAAEKEKPKFITEKDKSGQTSEKGKSDKVAEKIVAVAEKKTAVTPVKVEKCDKKEDQHKPAFSATGTGLKPGESDTANLDIYKKEKECNKSIQKPIKEEVMDTNDMSDSKQNVKVKETLKMKAVADEEESTNKAINESTTTEAKKLATDAKNKLVKDTFGPVGGNDKPKKWIDIMDCTNNEKILKELEKIGKLQAFKNRQKEHDEFGKMHKIRIFPLSVKDLATACIQDIINKAKLCVMKYGMVEKGVQKFGWLMAVFKTKTEVSDVVATIKKVREDLKVYYGAGEKSEKGGSWHTEWAKFVSKPDSGDLNVFRLFVPSLPQTIDEEDLWNMFPTARDISLVEAKPRKHAYIHFWSEKSVRAVLEELNAQGPPRDDLQFCRLLPQGDLHKLIVASKLGTGKNAATKGTESTVSGKHNTTNDRPQSKPQHKTLLDARGKPKNLMNIHLRQLQGSGRRPHKRRDFRSERPPYTPIRNDDPRGTLQTTFAQLQTQNMQMESEVIDNLQTLLSQVNQPEPRHRPSPRAPQQMWQNQHQAMPKPLMETLTERPARDIPPVQSDRGPDWNKFGSIKRSRSPVSPFSGIKRPRDRYVPHGRHSLSPQEKGRHGFVNADRMSESYDRPVDMNEDYNPHGGLAEQYHHPQAVLQDDFSTFGNFGNRNARTDYGMAAGSPYNSGDDGKGFQRGQTYVDDEDDYQKYNSPSPDQYGPDTRFSAVAEPLNSPSWSQPDQDYRSEPELGMNRSMGSMNPFTEFKPLKEPLLEQPRFPMGESHIHRPGSYY